MDVGSQGLGDGLNGVMPAQFEGSVDGNPVNFRVLFAGQIINLVGVEVLVGVMNDIEQQLPLPGEANTMRAQRRLRRG